MGFPRAGSSPVLSAFLLGSARLLVCGAAVCKIVLFWLQVQILPGPFDFEFWISDFGFKVQIVCGDGVSGNISISKIDDLSSNLSPRAIQ